MDLAPLTTLRLGGPARRLVQADTDDALIDAVTTAGEPVLVLAGGSNVVIADAGFDGLVVRVGTRGFTRARAREGIVRVTVAAGEPWDDVVAACVADGLAGIESLSGIPGSTGATPIQNVGAYGQDVSQTIASVRVHDRETGETLELAPPDCGFGYRSSRFKYHDRFLVLSVAFDLRESALGEPVAYAELARALDVELGAQVALADQRDAVLGLRRGKGMVVAPDDPDSVSAGSFFTNPILEAGDFEALTERAEERPPAWPEPDGRVKTSAAWLIQRAGFERGHGDGRAGISAKHTLALVNRGGATAAELLAVAREIARTVKERFGVGLTPEPVLVGLSWDE
jgi:UDP-N-acetylmuramate dehydrogenase